MKIIHCADVHLDAALNTNLSAQQAERRRNELLLTFLDLVAYAAQEGVSAIIIAGDLFDTRTVSWKTRAVLSDCIRQNPGIDFLYLPGNHDEQSFMNGLEPCGNLKCFTGEGSSCRYQNVVITGFLKPETAVKAVLRPEDTNIVVLHAALSDAAAFRGRNIDYLALGHIHKHQMGQIDERGMYCYSGCLEARGFDECNRTGFMLLSTQERGLHAQFIPFGRRQVRCFDVDISECGKTPQVCEKIECALAGTPQKDLVKVRLTGQPFVGMELNLEYIRQFFQERYFAFRLEDKTRLPSDFREYEQEPSLKGAFVRAVLASEETDAVKRDILQCGLRVLGGESPSEGQRRMSR